MLTLQGNRADQQARKRENYNHSMPQMRTGIQKKYSIGRQKTSAILPPQTRLILMVRLSQ
jgi:hypothetical protein